MTIDSISEKAWQLAGYGPEGLRFEDWPKRYDIASDKTMPVTQKDWDELMAVVLALQIKPQGAPAGSNLAIPSGLKLAGLKLAVFPNRMQPGRAFVAEAKEIEPYLDEQGRAIINLETSQPYYPVVPKTDWLIGCSFDQVFAQEIVRRWNSIVWERETSLDD